MTTLASILGQILIATYIRIVWVKGPKVGPLHIVILCNISKIKGVQIVEPLWNDRSILGTYDIFLESVK